MASKTVTFLLL